MQRVIAWFWRCFGWVLSLRYEVQVVGGEAIEKLAREGRPVVVLPNHPGFVDPPLVLSVVGPALQPRPLVWEGTFRLGPLRPIMRLVNAVEVPDLGRSRRQAAAAVKELPQQVAAGLARGESYIVWPSGRLQREGREVLGGARMAAEILAAAPQGCAVVLVRSEGLWGSRFGCAWTGGPPDLGRVVAESLGWLAMNLMWFMPRRQVRITCEVVDAATLPAGRAALNRALEEWFNAGTDARPVLVPRHVLARRAPTLPERAGTREAGELCKA